MLICLDAAVVFFQLTLIYYLPLPKPGHMETAGACVIFAVTSVLAFIGLFLLFRSYRNLEMPVLVLLIGALANAFLGLIVIPIVCRVIYAGLTKAVLNNENPATDSAFNLLKTDHAVCSVFSVPAAAVVVPLFKWRNPILAVCASYIFYFLSSFTVSLSTLSFLYWHLYETNAKILSVCGVAIPLIIGGIMRFVAGPLRTLLESVTQRRVGAGYVITEV